MAVVGLWLGLVALAGEPGIVDVRDVVRQVHRTPTEDGAEVAFVRYARPGARPVVLTHGISSNHRYWDLEPGRSLAWSLHEAGYDVWNMDFRGHGLAMRDEDGARQWPGWTIDDYGRHDLPAAFQYVRDETNHERLGYVGHSMGGMVLAIYLAHHPDPPLASAVAVGSPLDFRDSTPLVDILLQGAPIARVFRTLPSRLGARLLGRLGGSAPLSMDALLFNPDNLDRDASRRMLNAVVSPLTRGEVAQFAAVEDGEFVCIDGETVYREELGDVEVPVMLIAGRADRIATPDRVLTYYQALGSPQKRLVVAGRAEGFSADYGHLDLGVGDVAQDEIYPLIAEWLEETW